MLRLFNHVIGPAALVDQPDLGLRAVAGEGFERGALIGHIGPQLTGVAHQDQDRHVQLGHIGREVGVGEGVQGLGQRGHSKVALKRLDFKHGQLVGQTTEHVVLGAADPLRQASQRPIAEGLGNLLKELKHAPPGRAGEDARIGDEAFDPVGIAGGKPHRQRGAG